MEIRADDFWSSLTEMVAVYVSAVTCSDDMYGA